MLFNLLLGLFCLRVGFMLAVLIAGTLRPVGPMEVFFNGFKIKVGSQVKTRLTPAEYCAVMQHEEGHRLHLHTWENFLLACLFISYTEQRRREQELEADANVQDKQAMASVLLKLGVKSELDQYRFSLLSQKG